MVPALAIDALRVRASQEYGQYVRAREARGRMVRHRFANFARISNVARIEAECWGRWRGYEQAICDLIDMQRTVFTSHDERTAS